MAHGFRDDLGQLVSGIAQSAEYRIALVGCQWCRGGLALSQAQEADGLRDCLILRSEMAALHFGADKAF